MIEIKSYQEFKEEQLQETFEYDLEEVTNTPFDKKSFDNKLKTYETEISRLSQDWNYVITKKEFNKFDEKELFSGVKVFFIATLKSRDTSTVESLELKKSVYNKLEKITNKYWSKDPKGSLNTMSDYGVDVNSDKIVVKFTSMMDEKKYLKAGIDLRAKQ